MLEAGLASTTMVQRSKTAVVPTENFSRIARLGYNATIPTALTDRNSMCKPLAVERLRVKISMDHAAAQEPERWEALSKAGFKVEPYGDLITTIWDKWGGHYMDVGASAKIAKGLVSDVLFFFLVRPLFQSLHQCTRWGTREGCCCANAQYFLWAN